MCAAIRAAVIRGVLPSRAKPAGQGLGVCCPAAGIAAGQAVLRGWVGAAGWGACCAPGGWGMVSAGRFAAGTGQSAGVSGFLNFFCKLGNVNLLTPKILPIFINNP